MTGINAEDLAALAVKALEDRKGTDITVLDLRTTGNGVADFFVLATGASPPQLKAMSDEVQHAVKETAGQKAWRKAGVPEGGWLVLDYVDVVIHIFSPEARGYYAIEDLWRQVIPTAPRKKGRPKQAPDT